MTFIVGLVCFFAFIAAVVFAFSLLFKMCDGIINFVWSDVPIKDRFKAKGWQDLGMGPAIHLFDNQSYYFTNNGNNIYLNTELNLGYGKYYDGGAYSHHYVKLPNIPISSDEFYQILHNPVKDNSISPGINMMY